MADPCTHYIRAGRSTRSLPAVLSDQQPRLLQSDVTVETTAGTREYEDFGGVNDGDDEKCLMEPHDKVLIAVPWVTKPVSSTEKFWVRERDEAPEWLALLFDLVVVAVLTTFSLVRSDRSSG
jgi:hypothetical protein